MDPMPPSDGGPMEMIISMLSMHETNMYPSLETLDWLARGFQAWIDQDGRKSLEQCLGLKRPSGQAANALKEFRRRRTLDTLLVKMLLLHCGLGIRIKDAAGMVASLMDATADWNRTGFEFKPLSEDTLLAYWADSTWTKSKLIRGQARALTADEAKRKQLLSTFPRHCWQHLPELKAYLQS